MTKKSSFRDFIACGEHLLSEGYAAPGQLMAMGESAGGLLVAAVINRRPDLFTSVVVDCPFVDVLQALLDPSLPLTVSDWEEWGNPQDEELHSYIKSYSPCENVGAHDYPAILVLAGVNDPWVPVQQSIRWVKRLRELAAGEQPVYLQVDPETGHRGPADRFGFLRDVALKFAFLLTSLDSRLGRGRAQGLASQAVTPRC